MVVVKWPYTRRGWCSSAKRCVVFYPAINSGKPAAEGIHLHGQICSHGLGIKHRQVATALKQQCHSGYEQAPHVPCPSPPPPYSAQPGCQWAWNGPRPNNCEVRITFAKIHTKKGPRICLIAVKYFKRHGQGGLSVGLAVLQQITGLSQREVRPRLHIVTHHTSALRLLN